MKYCALWTDGSARTMDMETGHDIGALCGSWIVVIPRVLQLMAGGEMFRVSMGMKEIMTCFEMKQDHLKGLWQSIGRSELIEKAVRVVECYDIGSGHPAVRDLAHHLHQLGEIR